MEQVHKSIYVVQNLQSLFDNLEPKRYHYYYFSFSIPSGRTSYNTSSYKQYKSNIDVQMKQKKLK